MLTPNIRRKLKWFAVKSISLLSVIRGYNILVIIIAQYVSSIFILSAYATPQEVLLDHKLFYLILSSAICIASGYIINNFYDSEKDLINRPHKSKLDRLVSQQKKLIIYFIFNFIAVIIASYVSFRAVLFFSVYIFGIWFYSHKLKRISFVGNISATVLAILPFFVVFIYYKNFNEVIFIHALFLALILFLRELIKDLENIKGDMASGYNTIPVKYGENFTKNILIVVSISAIVTALLLIYIFSLGYMFYYFWVSILLLIFVISSLSRASFKKHYLFLHNVIKLIILLGVFSIPLIKPETSLHLFS